MGCHLVPRLRYAQLVNIVGVITVYIVTYFRLLPAVLHDWPYSPYYNGTAENLDVVRKVVWVRFYCHCVCVVSLSFLIVLNGNRDCQKLHMLIMTTL